MANPYESTDPFKEFSRGTPSTPGSGAAGWSASTPPPTAAPPTVAGQDYAPPTTPFAMAQKSYATENPTPPLPSSGFSGDPPSPLDQFYKGTSPPSSIPQNSVAFGAVPMPQSSSTPPPEPIIPTSKFWTIQFYQQFFDVDTRLVLLRMSNTLVPINPPDFLMDRDWRNAEAPEVPQQELQEFGVTLSRKPDLYGPFWICTTLWMTLGIVSNIMGKISFNHKAANSPNVEKWTYDFTMASMACVLIYLYCFGLSSIVWGIMKYKGLPVSLLDTLCLYGYSMFIFILVASLCMIPVSAVQWAVVMVGGAWSTAFLLINFWNVWKVTLPPSWLFSFALIVGIPHMTLTMSFKFYFMNYKY